MYCVFEFETKNKYQYIRREKEFVSKALSTLRCFQKCPFSSRRKRSTFKIFSSTLAFSYRFHLSTQKLSKTMKTTGTWDCVCVNITRPSAILDRCFDLDWNRWHVTLFTSPFSKVSVFTCPH